MDLRDIQEPYLDHFLRKHSKDLAIFAIKKPLDWEEFAICMRQHLNENSKIATVFKNASVFSLIFPREIRNYIALLLAPSGYRNAGTLQKMRLLFLGDLPPLKPTPSLDGIPIKTLALWIDHNRVPIHTLLKNSKALEDLLPELECVDLTSFQLESHFSMLNQVHKVHELTIQFFSKREFKLISRLEKLKSLTFKECGILDNDCKYIKNLVRLTSLSFITCYYISDHALKILKNIPNLTSLTISKCEQLTNIGIHHISSLLKLTHLDISFCSNITDEGILALKELPLKHLNITYCHKITNVGLKPFSHTKINSRHCHKIT